MWDCQAKFKFMVRAVVNFVIFGVTFVITLCLSSGTLSSWGLPTHLMNCHNSFCYSFSFQAWGVEFSKHVLLTDMESPPLSQLQTHAIILSNYIYSCFSKQNWNHRMIQSEINIHNPRCDLSFWNFDLEPLFVHELWSGLSELVWAAIVAKWEAREQFPLRKLISPQAQLWCHLPFFLIIVGLTWWASGNQTRPTTWRLSYASPPLNSIAFHRKFKAITMIKLESYYRFISVRSWCYCHYPVLSFVTLDKGRRGLSVNMICS